MKTWLTSFIFSWLTKNGFGEIDAARLDKLFDKGAKQIGVEVMNSKVAEYLKSPRFLDEYDLKDITHQYPVFDLSVGELESLETEWVLLAPRRGSFRAFGCPSLKVIRGLSQVYRAGPVVSFSDSGIVILENEVYVKIYGDMVFGEWKDLFQANGLEVIDQFRPLSGGVYTTLKASDATGMGMVEVVSSLREHFPEGKVGYLIDGETYPTLH